MKIYPVRNYPAYGLTKDGRVWSRWQRISGGHSQTVFAVIGKKWKQLRPGLTAYGYRALTLSGSDGKRRQCFVHVLMLETFVGPKPDGHEARHLNGNRSDNRESNLAWCTPRVNQLDRWKHGTMTTAKLTANQVGLIRESFSKGVRQCVLAKRFGVTRGTVWKIVRPGPWSTWMQQ